MKRLARRFAPEVVATALLAVAFVASAAWQPRFLDLAYLFDRSALQMETGLLALSLTLVIVAGQIDLSCTAILALAGALALTAQRRLGLPPALLIPLAPLLGALCGAVNGALVARAKLPSLVVTLATMALFRGSAQILLGDHSLPVPPALVGIEKRTLPGTYIHAPLLLYLAAAVAAGLILHRTVFGRWVVATGTSAEAARHAGVPVERVVFRLFVLSGAVSGIAALLLLSRLGVARFDHARGMELDAITAVVLGGTSIFGGRGTIVGSVAALALLGVVQTGMGVAGVKAEIQVAAVGALLLLAVLATRLLPGRRE